MLLRPRGAVEPHASGFMPCEDDEFVRRVPSGSRHQCLGIQTKVINEAFGADAQKLFFLGSSCIYLRG
ncbi:MAG TPA: hypothetical protein VNE59_06685 [Burkholderiales bacterium]|nr:hypothetical protein [Burkholderiales bacterium]